MFFGKFQQNNQPIKENLFSTFLLDTNTNLKKKPIRKSLNWKYSLVLDTRQTKCGQQHPFLLKNAPKMLYYHNTTLTVAFSFIFYAISFIMAKQMHELFNNFPHHKVRERETKKYDLYIQICLYFLISSSQLFGCHAVCECVYWHCFVTFEEGKCDKRCVISEQMVVCRGMRGDYK